MHTFQMGTKFGVNVWICMTFHCYVLLQFSPTFTVVLEAGGTHACVPPAHIGQALIGMFMKISNFCVFNKMVSDRKILWFPSKWGVNHLKRWRNGEVVGKKRIMNYSQKLWPGTANWHKCTILCVKVHFFTTKEHLTKMRFCFLKFGCY